MHAVYMGNMATGKMVLKELETWALASGLYETMTTSKRARVIHV